MWIKEIPNNYMEEKSFAVDAIFLWKSDNHPIYVMDNHLCATWCWLQECDFHSSYNFMHIDQHSDCRENQNTLQLNKGENELDKIFKF